ncbi:MAG: TIGR04086 family membrane protein, partial [Clostridia bacterium]|nr:TIGR04086 family membrane protein [Clostridia bacterium]
MRTALSRRAGGVWLDLLKGVLAAVAVTAALVILFALLISLFSVSDGAIRTVNQIIKLAAIVAGVCVAARRGDARGLARGAAVGLIYMAAGVLLYAALTA